jgi:hypothetical protein
MDNQLTTNCKHEFWVEKRWYIRFFEQQWICKRKNSNKKLKPNVFDVKCDQVLTTEVWKQESTVWFHKFRLKLRFVKNTHKHQEHAVSENQRKFMKNSSNLL